MKEEHQKRQRSLDRMHAKRRIPRYRSLLAHWTGRFLRAPSRAEAAPLPSPKRGQVAITCAGHATVLIRYGNLSILCDPMLRNWRGWVRREIQAGLSPAELADVDLILISNQDIDHLDPETLAMLPRSATVVVPPQGAQHLSSLGFARVIELGADQNVEHRRVDVSAVAVQHGGKVPALAYVIRGDGPSVFFCGASGYFDGFASVGRRFKPDIALLPISGYLPRSFRREHMSPLDALYAFEDLRSKVMIPIRHSAFALSYEKLREPSRWLAELVAERDLENYVIPIAPGQSRTFVRPQLKLARPSSRAESSAEPEDAREAEADASSDGVPESVPMELHTVKYQNEGDDSAAIATRSPEDQSAVNAAQAVEDSPPRAGSQVG